MIRRPFASTTSSLRLHVALLCCLASPGMGSIGLAEDLIYLKKAGTDNPIPIPGEVIELTGRTLRFRSSNNSRPRDEPTSSLLRIERPLSDAWKRAQAQFENGQYEAAEQEWTSELKTETRAWVRREIRACLLKNAWRRDHWAAACQQFLEITAEDPDTFHWAIAPLIWTSVSLRPADQQLAQNWINDNRPVARLLGSSLLLTDPRTAETARATLNELQRDPAPFVAGLARAQLWRLRLGVPLSDQELSTWQANVRAQPESVRSGPQYLLARAFQARSQYDRAAAEFLWVPINLPQHEPTAARASLDAAEMSLRAGRPSDAITLYQRTIDQFSWSHPARDARLRLKELEQPTPAQ